MTFDFMFHKIKCSCYDWQIEMKFLWMSNWKVFLGTINRYCLLMIHFSKCAFYDWAIENEMSDFNWAIEIPFFNKWSIGMSVNDSIIEMPFNVS